MPKTDHVSVKSVPEKLIVKKEKKKEHLRKRVTDKSTQLLTIYQRSEGKRSEPTRMPGSVYLVASDIKLCSGIFLGDVPFVHVQFANSVQ